MSIVKKLSQQALTVEIKVRAATAFGNEGHFLFFKF